MAELAAETLMFALYGLCVFFFCRAFYFQARIIFQMFRLFYDSFGLLPWRAFGNRAVIREGATTLGSSAAFQSNRRNLFGAIKMSALSFVCFFSLVLLFHVILPEAEFWLLKLEDV